jgi:hypothetical protein
MFYLTTAKKDMPEQGIQIAKHKAVEIQGIYDYLYGGLTILPELPQLPQVPEPQDIQRFRTRRIEITDHGLYELNQRIAPHTPKPTIFEDMNDHYTVFQIPKHSGGMRTIKAPSEELKREQRKVLDWLISIGCHAHDSAYAYIKGRSIKHALAQHAANGSQWFLKLDIQDFFPSCTKDVVLQQLLKLWPTCAFNAPAALFSKEQFQNIMHVCFLDNELPQGAVTSPMLSNLVMLPVDYRLTHELWNYNKQHFVYTRYADDILISSKYKFNPVNMEYVVQHHITAEQLPFKINTKKTRFGSRSGANWNLGLMLNKDNNITLGHRFKQKHRPAIFQFLSDYKNKNYWTPQAVASLAGHQAYLTMIEPQYAQYILQHYKEKLMLSFHTAVSNILKGTVPPNL